MKRNITPKQFEKRMAEANGVMVAPTPEVDDPPEFPIEVFPPVMADMATGIASKVQVPIGIAAAATLGIISSTTGRSLYLKHPDGTRTPGNLYLFLGMESGTGKSQMWEPLIAPVRSCDKDRVGHWEDTTKPEVTTNLHCAEIECKKAKDNYRKAKTRADKDEARETLKEQERIKADCKKLLNQPSLYIEDGTQQAIEDNLYYNNGLLSILGSEPRSAIDNIMGRGKGVSEDSPFLKGFSGDEIRVRRSSRENSHRNYNISDPWLSVTLMVQPDKMEEMYSKPSFRDSGLLPRILPICIPFLDPEETGQPIPCSTQSAWDACIHKLLNTYRPSSQDYPLEISTRVHNKFKQYHREITKQINDGTLYHIREFARRWVEFSMRITVCLHAATHEGVANSREIATDTVEDAISLTRWFSYHQKTYLEEGEVNHTDAMLDKIMEFVGRNPDGATAREVQQQVHLPSADLTRMYLDKLVPGRLTRVEVPPPKEKGGHTKVIYRLPEQ